MPVSVVIYSGEGMVKDNYETASKTTQRARKRT